MIELHRLPATERTRLAAVYRDQGYVQISEVALPRAFAPAMTDFVFIDAEGSCEVFIGSQISYRGTNATWSEITNGREEPGNARLVAAQRGDFFSGLTALLELLRGEQEITGEGSERSESPSVSWTTRDDEEARRAGMAPPPELEPKPGLRDLVLQQQWRPGCFNGRRGLLRTLQTALLRSTKPGVVLIGESGVGKTTLMQLLASEVAAGLAPSAIVGSSIVEVSLGQFVESGRPNGVITEQFRQLISELPRGTIFFIDEIEQLARSELRGLGDVIKPLLDHGEMRLVGATTPTGWKELADETLKRRFLEMVVEQPTTEETFAMLHQRKLDLEEHHDLEMTEDIVREAIVLADRCLPQRSFPDKAVDLLDHAGAMQSCSPQCPVGDDEQLMRRFLLEATAVESGQAVELFDRELCKGLLSETIETLEEQLLGQEQVFGTLQQLLAARFSMRFLSWEAAIRTLASKRDRRPLAAVLACGPTGVGKTETARILADVFFSGRMIALHGSDVGPEAKHGTAMWVGSPPGYKGSDLGGSLTNELRLHGSALILVDEIEKASADAIQNILIPLLGEGVVTDRNNGETLWVDNCIVFCTSNIALQSKGSRAVGFSLRQSDDLLDAASVFESLTRYLLPEIVGRFNAILPYEELDVAAMWAVWSRLTEELVRKLGVERSIVLDDAAEGLLEERFLELKTGARGVQDLFRDELYQLAASTEVARELRVTACDGGLALERDLGVEPTCGARLAREDDV